jgi:hypothetical protein
VKKIAKKYYEEIEERDKKRDLLFVRATLEM